MASVIPVQDPKLAGKSPRAIAVSLRRPASVHAGAAAGARIGPRTIYLSSGKMGLPLLVWGCALVNVIFWGNLADWTWRDYSVQVVPSPSPSQHQHEQQQQQQRVQDAQSGQSAAAPEEDIRYERASTRQRATYAIGLAALGLGISTAFMLVSRRVINRIDMMPDGSSVLLHTGFLRRSTAAKAGSGSIVPLTDLSLKASLDLASSPGAGTVGNYTQLLRKKQIVGYLIDRRGHFLGGPKVLDELFMRSV